MHHRIFVAAFNFADQTRNAFFDVFQIGQHQLGFNRFRILDRVHATINVGHIVIVETTQHMRNRIAFADVSQELVSQTFAFRCTFYQTSNIYERHTCWDDCFGTSDCGQNIQAFIGHGDFACVGFNRTKREIRGLCGGGACQRVK